MNTSALSVTSGYEVDPTTIEDVIKKKFAEFAKNHMMPLIDTRQLEFRHRMSLTTATCISIHISCKKIKGGDTQITGIVLPQGANPRNTEEAYVIANCIVGKPRA